MKYSKQPSLSTDTRLSRSGIFNNSSINASSNPIETSNNFYMSNNINNCENKQLQFLRIKNGQLEQKNKRLTAQVKELEINKNQILAINSKYVDVVNRYYQSQNKKIQKDKSSTGFRSTKQPLNLTVSVSSTQAHRVLEQLQKDHRNLVKHCLAMEEQIKNYTKQMQKFEEMKNHLRSVNHESVLELIEQIEDLNEENKNLRKNNNSITYQLEKFKEECKKIKKVHSAKQKQAGDSSAEIAKMRSLINTTQQESMDKANAYEARIYQLELKVEKLEKQLRDGQKQVMKTYNIQKNLELKQVQQVHDYQKLQQSLTDLLRGRQRANSLYTRARNPSKNLLDISVNNAIQRNSQNKNSIAKNQRRSLADKSRIIL